MPYEYKLPTPGERPEWLADFDMIDALWEGAPFDDFDLDKTVALDWPWGEDPPITHIMLEDNHWAVPILRKGFVPCTKKPNEYTGGKTFWSNGVTSHENRQLSKDYWNRERLGPHVIGYMPVEEDPLEAMKDIIHELAGEDYYHNFGPIWTQIRDLSNRLQPTSPLEQLLRFHESGGNVGEITNELLEAARAQFEELK